MFRNYEVLHDLPLSRQNGTRMKRAASTRRKLSSSTDSLRERGRGLEWATNFGAVLLAFAVRAATLWCMPVVKSSSLIKLCPGTRVLICIHASLMISQRGFLRESSVQQGTGGDMYLAMLEVARPFDRFRVDIMVGLL